MVKIRQIYDIKLNIMEKANKDIIIDIENDCLKGKTISEQKRDYYLSYLVYKVRCEAAKFYNQSLDDWNFKDSKEVVISSLKSYFDKLNIKYKIIDMNDVVKGIRHQFMIVSFQSDDGEVSFIVDPTYNQFFGIKMCNSDVYKEEAGRTIKKPDLGYFILKETKEYQNLVKKFLQNGYMILNETNAKIYGDSFSRASVYLEDYNNGMSGCMYIKRFNRCAAIEKLKSSEELIDPITLNFYKNKV